MSIADNAQAPALLIDGQDVPAASTRTVYDPCDRRADRRGRRRHGGRRRPRRRGRAGRVPPRRLEPDHAGRALRGARPHGRPAGGARGRVRPHRVAQHRQAAEVLERLRRPAHDRQPALLRRRRPQPRGQGVGRVPRRPDEHDPARADRRLRLDRAVELPAQHGGVEDRAGARGRQHGRAQAGRADAADGADARPPGARRRPAAGRAERGARPRPGGRRRARPPRGRRADLGHRLDPHRRERHARCRRHRQARAHGARRQGAVRGVRGRRPRGGRRGRDRRRLRQLRPGLHGRHPHLRPRAGPRRVHGALPAQGRPAGGGRPDGRRDQPRPARLARPARPRPRASSSAPSPPARAPSAAARCPTAPAPSTRRP